MKAKKKIIIVDSEEADYKTNKDLLDKLDKIAKNKAKPKNKKQ